MIKSDITNAANYLIFDPPGQSGTLTGLQAAALNANAASPGGVTKEKMRFLHRIQSNKPPNVPGEY
jgi:hypothetical protein